MAFILKERMRSNLEYKLKYLPAEGETVLQTPAVMERVPFNQGAHHDLLSNNITQLNIVPFPLPGFLEAQKRLRKN